MRKPIKQLTKYVEISNSFNGITVKIEALTCSRRNLQQTDTFQLITLKETV